MTPSPARLALMLTILLLPLGLATLQASASAPTQGAYGVTPTDVNFEGVLRGEPIMRAFEIQNARDEPVRVSLSRQGPLGEWARLAHESFVVPARTTHLVEMRLAAPADAPNGAYAGRITVTFEPASRPAGNTSEVSLAFAVPVKLDATVTGQQILRLSAGGVHVPDVEERTRVPVSAILHNRGNVYAMPVLHAEVTDTAGRLVHSARVDLPRIPAGETVNVTQQLDASLPRGQYRLKATLVVAGETILDETVAFDVLSFGELRRKGEMDAIRTADVTRAPNHRLPAGDDFLVLVPFRNVGEVDVNAQFKGYIASGGRIVSFLQSETIRVAPGENATLRVLVTDVKGSGAYHILGAVHYDGKVTDEHETVLTLEESPVAGRATPGAAPALILGVAALAAIVLRRRAA